MQSNKVLEINFCEFQKHQIVLNEILFYNIAKIYTYIHNYNCIKFTDTIIIFYYFQYLVNHVH